VTYGSVLAERRRVLHDAIVGAIERIHADRLAEHGELLAHHASRGELWEKAVEYFHRAGQKAAARSATREAIAYFEQALEALRHLPENRRTIEQAISIRVDLGPALIATTSFSAAEVEKNYNYARELCEQLGETPQLFPVLWGLARVHDVRGALHVGRELGKQLVATAQRMQDPALILEAHHELWANSLHLGEFSSALTHTERGIELYNPQEHRQYAFLYGGHDPGVCGLRHAAMILSLLGYPDQALQKSQDALELAQKLSHPNSLAFALYYSAWVHQQRGESQAVDERIEATITLAKDQGFTRWLQQGSLLQGWLLAQQGEGQEAIRRMRHGSAAAMDAHSHGIALLAETYGKEGQIEEGLRVLNEELARLQITGGRFYVAELHRIKGELLAQAAADEQQAEACFQSALQIARGQSTKSLELRAAMSLSRLWQRQGKTAKARKLLEDIYGWFTEGFDTADLKEAKALLEELT
jgi:predicted ATPase